MRCCCTGIHRSIRLAVARPTGSEQAGTGPAVAASAPTVAGVADGLHGVQSNAEAMAGQGTAWGLIRSNRDRPRDLGRYPVARDSGTPCLSAWLG